MLPAERRSAMIPLPTTAASDRAVPVNSATSRLESDAVVTCSPSVLSP